MVGEFIEFEDGIEGIVLNFEDDNVGVVLMGEGYGIQEGSMVKVIGKIVVVFVGEVMLGCVVNFLGCVIDGKGEIVISEMCFIEFMVFGIIQCKLVYELMQIGIIVIDVMIFVGCGQCELIIGDCQIGKIVIVIDMILNQVDQDMICVYVVVGQKVVFVVNVVEVLCECGVFDYIVIVVVNVFEFVVLQYLVFYIGVIIVEYFMYKGKVILVIYDDFFKQVVVYCQMLFLLCCLFGCEVYFGDVFYCYSCLFECVVKLFDVMGKGFMIVLLIIEIQVGDVLVYIFINVILIMDGQIFFSFDLFNLGLCFVINVGIFVSWVGGVVQIKVIKKIVGILKLELVQFDELVVFFQFVFDLDVFIQQQLECGKCLCELFKQFQFSFLIFVEQVVIVYVGVKGFIDDVFVEKVVDFFCELCEYFKFNKVEFIIEIQEKKVMSFEVEVIFKDVIIEVVFIMVVFVV